MIAGLFVAVRLPVFVIGVLLYTAFIVIMAPWTTALAILVVPFWLICILPFQAIGFALDNDEPGLRLYFKKKRAEWLQIFEFVRNMPNAYTQMYKWLIGA